MAPFSKEDKILIKSLYECKGYNARQFITDRLKLKKFVTADRRPGSSRPRSARTDENVDTCIIFGMQFETIT